MQPAQVLEDKHFRGFEPAFQTHPYFERQSRLKSAKFGCNHSSDF